MNGTYGSYLRRESLSMGLRVAVRKNKTKKQTNKKTCSAESGI